MKRVKKTIALFLLITLLVSVAVLLPASSASAAVSASGNPEPIYPYTLDPSKVWMYKIFMDGRQCGTSGASLSNKTIDQAFAYIKEVDSLTRGIPKIAILVGCQEGGHDYQWPSWDNYNNPNIRRTGDTNSEDSIRWLAEQAKAYNTKITFHMNITDANQSNSSAWNTALSNEWIARDPSTGNLIDTGEYFVHDINNPSTLYMNYVTNIKKMWDDGELKRKADAFIAKFQFIKDTKALYFDQTCRWRDSRNNGVTYTYAQQKQAWWDLCNYLKNIYGISAVAEGWDNAFVGSVPYALNQIWYSSGFDVAPYQAQSGKISASSYDNSLWFGCNSQLEDNKFHEDTYNVQEDFAMRVLPTQYLNTKMRLSITTNGSVKTAIFSDDVTCYNDPNISSEPSLAICITDGGTGYFRQKGKDVFIPLNWKPYKEMYHYNYTGTTQNWYFPADWNSVTNVDVYRVIKTGLVKTETNAALSSDGTRKYKSIGTDGTYKGHIIVPTGTTPDGTTTFTASGTASFLTKDSTTKGNWKNVVGQDGYYIVGDTSSLPSYATMDFKGGTETSYSYITNPNADTSLLQKAANSDRVAAGRAAPLNETVEIDVGSTERNVSFYMRSFGHSRMAVEVIDLNSNQTIKDSQIVDDFDGGVYLTYKVKNKVGFRFTNINFDQEGAVFSGIFFGGSGTESDTYLSNLNWYSATTGWGTVQKDKSSDGNTITLNGGTYSKGIGTHAASNIIYNFANGIYKEFKTDVGVDDESGSGGSVAFKIYTGTNGTTWTLKYDSGTMTGSSPTKTAIVDLSGVTWLKLEVNNGGDDINYDHANWALARLSKATKAPRVAVAVSSTVNTDWADEKAIDNSTGIDNGWSSAQQSQTGSQYISVDMGANYSIGKIKVIPRTNSAGSVYCFPEDFKFQYSTNGTTWTDIPSLSYTAYANPSNNNGEAFSIAAPVNARYIRMLGTKFRTDGSLYFMQICEMYLYYSDECSNVPAGYTYCADEGQSYTLTGTCDVAYGANGQFNYLYGQTGTIAFNNATFGDPCPGVVKKGYYKAASGSLTQAPRSAATGSSTVNTDWPASEAIDSNNGNDNGWSSVEQSQTGSQFLEVDMGANYNISQIKVIPRTYNNSVYCFPQDFKFQYSTGGGIWYDIPNLSYTNYSNPANNSGEIFNLASPITARYIKMVGTKFRIDPLGQYYMQLGEIYLSYTEGGA